MNNQKKYIFAFSLLPMIGPARFRKLKTGFSSFEKAWQATRAELTKKAGLDEKTAQKIKTEQTKIDPDKEFQKFSEGKIDFITENDSAYPHLLKEIKSAPFVLFFLGNVELLKKKQLAIVGTRKISPYGKMVAERIAGQIAHAGLVVTSGMAQGVDTAAHKAATDSSYPTIAVLGGGVSDVLKNSFAKRTAQNILSCDGLIVSEYPPSFSATRFTFPARNRIISGLCLGTLVIEAGEKSGALITANCALDQNREVFAVPGNIFSPSSVGTNKLIANGAQVVTSADDILEILNFATGRASANDATEKEIEFQNKDQQKIFELLSFEPLHIDKIAKKTKFQQTLVTSELSLMELAGSVVNVGGGRFIRK